MQHALGLFSVNAQVGGHMRHVQSREAKESGSGTTWRQSGDWGSTKPDYDTDYLDEAIASGMRH